MRRFLAFGFLLFFAAPSAALTLPPSVHDDLAKSGRLGEVTALLDSARARGVADRAACAARLGSDFNAGGRLPDRIVVILVDFPDHPAQRATFTRDWFRKLLFSVGETATGSLRDYYREVSYGSFDVQGLVVGWYTMPQPLAYYTGGASGLGTYPNNAQRLAEDALRAADADVNFALFDNDGPDGLPDSGDDDHYVDAVLVVHAGPGAELTGSKQDIWSHQWMVPTEVHMDGVRGGLYFTVPEDARVGIACHEFGHILGLVDLYDTDGDGAGLGLWSLMAYGASSSAGVRPPHPDAWSMVKLGFVTPIVPAENLTSVSIPPVETAPVVYKLWTDGGASLEYFLVENRQRTGFDASLPGEGLLIYHVDDMVLSNDDQNHYHVALEQADGQRQLEGGAWYGNLGDRGDPYPGIERRDEFSIATVPSSRAYNLSPSAVAVRRIHSSGSSITADLLSYPVPVVEPVAMVVQDADGDGCLAPGETASLAAVVRNSGEAGGPWQLSLVSLSPALSVDPEEVNVPAIGEGPAEARSGWIAARAEEGAEGPASVRAAITEAGATVAEGVFTVWLGSAPRRVGDIDDAPGWSVDPDGESALWVREPDPGDWRLQGSYAGYSEAFLTGPVFPARPGAVLAFSYRSALPGPEGVTADGVDVEGSLNGAAWTPLAPLSADELPALTNPAMPLSGRSALTDTTRGWVKAVYALGVGGAWAVRFNFGSDGVQNGGSFEIDSLEAGDALTPIGPAVTCVRSGGAVRIAVSVADPGSYVGAAFSRSSGGGAFERLHAGWIDFDGGRAAYEDTKAPARALYRVTLLGREGQTESFGPYAAEEAGAPGLALVCANPFSASLRLEFRVPVGSGPYAIRVYDVAGRRIAEVAAGEDTGGAPVACVWDGRDGRGPAAAGLYFVRLEHPGRALTVRALRLP